MEQESTTPVLIIEAAVLAPSAKNRQPWKYIVYMGESKAKLLEVMECALEKENERHELLPRSAFGLPDAFHTVKVMREAAVVIVVMNTNGKSPFEPIDADLRFAEISDSLAIGASIENMLLKATELGLGTLRIANTCFAYEDMTREVFYALRRIIADSKNVGGKRIHGRWCFVLY